MQKEERKEREILLLGIYNTILSPGQVCLQDVTRLRTLMNVRSRAPLNYFQRHPSGESSFLKAGDVLSVCSAFFFFRDCQS